MAYILNKAIQHLDSAVKGVYIINKKHVIAFSISKCELYALFKAYQLIFRFPKKSEGSEKPFHKNTYNLI